MRIAIVGGGIAGLGAAWLLDRRHDVTLFEAAPRAGGHSNTIEVERGGQRIPVDTGFIVYNELNYPNLTRLFSWLGVATRPSDMSFSASVGDGRMEYSGSSIQHLFAQRRNLIRPDFLRMLFDIWRFNESGKKFVALPGDMELSLGQFLDEGRFGRMFRRAYLLPMAAAIWSAPLEALLEFPARSFLAFFANHGLLNINDRPQWRTVVGGAQAYVRRLTMGFGHRIVAGTPIAAVRRLEAGIEVVTLQGQRQRFDQVVLACHADQALAMLEEPTPVQRRLLACFPYQPNRAVLHSDPGLMPRRPRVWSAWNYLATGSEAPGARVAVTYWMNRLQSIDPAHPLFVSINPLREPAPGSVIWETVYQHPVFDGAAVRAQTAIRAIQGEHGIWYAGAWLGHGFHEDGLKSGFEVARALGAVPPWEEAGQVRRLDTAFGLPERAAAQAV